MRSRVDLSFMKVNEMYEEYFFEMLGDGNDHDLSQPINLRPNKQLKVKNIPNLPVVYDDYLNLTMLSKAKEQNKKLSNTV